MVADEMRSIDVEAIDLAARAQLQDATVVAAPALAPALPAIHPLAAVRVPVLVELRAPGQNQVLHAREEVVVRAQGLSAEAALTRMLRGETLFAAPRPAAHAAMHDALAPLMAQMPDMIRSRAEQSMAA